MKGFVELVSGICYNFEAALIFMAQSATKIKDRNFETKIQRISANNPFETAVDFLAVEEPLEIRLGFGKEHRAVSITMRTPSNDAELAAGFLFTEGILQSKNQIKSIKHCGKFPNNQNTIRVDLAENVEIDFKRLERNFYTTSSCGVCGKTSLEALTVGLHAAALFEFSGNLIDLKEDVGRHNAVDKLIGRQFLENNLPLADKILFLSGRASFELIQKGVMAQIPIVCAVGAPSSLAVEAAKEFNITLLGFVRDRRFNIYCSEERIISESRL
jgi:FdhD protein